MSQQRLFVPAPEVMHLAATFVHGQGWHLTVVVRAEGGQWDDAYRAQYSHLGTAELADVIGEETAQRLRL